MDRTPVESSLIKSIGHNPADNTLEVEFHKGGVYSYAGVPAEAHAALMAAESIGSHFLKNVKGRYAHTKIEAEPKSQGAQS